MPAPHKPHLAVDAEIELLRFPILALPKMDGVRGINLNGKFTGRSLKPHGNRILQKMFSGADFTGLDGELLCYDLEMSHKDQCRLTTSRVNSHEGFPDVIWMIFDCIDDGCYEFPYIERMRYAEQVLLRLRTEGNTLAVSRIFMIPAEMIRSVEELETYENRCLTKGFEGVVLRDPQGKHKNGRCTVREGAYLRIKRFTDGDAVVTEVIEGQTNLNQPTINELGQTERSTHAANMVPNGMVGGLLCKIVETGEVINVAPGRMTHNERRHFLENPDEIIGKTIKFQSFAHGKKDKPRFPTFQALRLDADQPVS